MARFVVWFSLLCAACSAPQPASLRSVAAVEVPLPSAADKTAFLDLLSEEAMVYGYHVDQESQDDLRELSEVSPFTLNAAVWRGKDDEESIASAMDFHTHIGRVWLTFARGQEPEKSARFREAVLARIHHRWPDARSLPIMPDGSIPNVDDLRRTPSGYVAK
jgi:hypothetical protein